jgi:PAS domain S-box-containing protein
MDSNFRTPEDILETALGAVKRDGDFHAVLDRLPAAIYITDCDGVIVHYNHACIALAGRTPAIQQDKWCVTWKLYTTDGDFLPHDQCPMAVAIRERRPVRGVEAIAERPDGSTINFVPYPTPIFDDEGRFVGAVNMLIDVTEHRQSAYLRAQALRCRRLAASVGDERTRDTLWSMATEYEEQAARFGRLH